MEEFNYKDFNAKKNIKKKLYDVLLKITKFIEDNNFSRWLPEKYYLNLVDDVKYKNAGLLNYLNKNLEATTVGYLPLFSKYREAKIYLKKNKGSKHNIAHEMFHAISLIYGDGLGNYDEFLGEGITEFLARLCDFNDSEDSIYKDNVETVKLLYKMYGDRIIRDYLMGKGNEFFVNLEKEACNQKTDSERYYRMISDAKYGETAFYIYQGNEYYDGKKKGYNVKDSTTRERNLLNKDSKQLIQIGRDMLVKNYYKYIMNKIKQFYYIKDGKVQFQKFLTEVSTTFFYACKLGCNLNLLNDYNSRLLRDLVKYSHLLYSKDKKEKEKIKDSIYEKINDAYSEMIEAYENGDMNMLTKAAMINQEEEPFKSLNINQAKKMEEMFLNEKNFSNKDTFFDIIEKVRNLARATNMSDEYLNYTILKIAKKISKKPIQFSILAKKYLTATKQLDKEQKEFQRKSDYVEYKRIKLDGFDDKTTYLEKRNYKYYIMFLDEDTGDISRLPLNSDMEKSTDNENLMAIKYYGNTAKILEEGEISDDIEGDGWQEIFGYRIINPDKKAINEISFTDDIVDVEIGKGKAIKDILDSEKLKVDILSRITSKMIIKDLKIQVKER